MVSKMHNIIRLIYKVTTNKDIDYDRAKEVRKETDDFIFKLNNKIATFEPKKIFAENQLDELKSLADDFLKNFQTYTSLISGPPGLKFRLTNVDYNSIETIKDGKKHTAIKIHETVYVSDKVEAHVSKNKFPNFHENFKLSEDLELMYKRYEMYRKGEESLLSIAYFCKTFIESKAGGINDAAQKYNVSPKILKKLGHLSSKGNPAEARKAQKDGSIEPLKPEDHAWIEKTMRVLMLRMGEYEHSPEAPLKRICVDDIAQAQNVSELFN
jgi:hypothetical protein